MASAYPEHRRILATGGSFTPDTDWRAAGTWPTVVAERGDLSGAAVIPFVAKTGKALVMVELRELQGGDGIADDATFIAPGSFTCTIEILCRHRVQGDNVIVQRAELTGCVACQHYLEEDLPRDAECIVRVSAASTLGAADAIWIYVATDV